MTAKVIDGTAIAVEVRAEVARRVEALVAKGGRRPKLVAVLVGDDPASHTYVRGKTAACAEVGIDSDTLLLPTTVSHDEVLEAVRRLNEDPAVTGILVQMPLPPQVDEHAIVDSVLPAKDADGLHPYNLGLLLQGTPHTIPATPAGVQQLLLRSGYDPAGKHVVVVGRSMLVGKPVAALLSNKAEGANATVTLAHTGTRDLASVTRLGDILIAAMGRPGTITAEMVKPGAVVIDVGTTRVDDPSRKRGWRLAGDLDFAGVSEVAEAITPVPGGVGPMTIAMLLVNTVRAAGG